MLLAEIREQIIRYALAKGIVTDESSLNYDAIDTDIISGYNTIGAQIIKSRGKLSSQWMLSTSVQYDRSIQPEPNKYTVYEVPNAINGIYSYFRGEDGETGGRIVQSEAEYYSGIIKHIPKAVRGFVSNGFLKVNTAMSRNVVLTAAFTDPRQLPDWNPEYDNFPMDNDSVLQLIEILGKVLYQYVANTPLDTKTDSAETLKTPNQQ